jgi:aldehyde dehydrogenase (NAD(P)+)
VRSARVAYPAARTIPGGRLLVAAGANRGAPRSGSVDSAEAWESAVPEDMLRTEYFAPVLGIVELAGSGQAFLDAAVETVNRDFLGTLGANILGVPSTIRRLGAGFEQAVARLRYGTIAINAWTGVGFLSAAAPWGAFPGHTLSDVQSGIGVVHNALLLDDVERTVVRGPFRPFPHSIVHGEWALLPKPPWFMSARSGALTARLLTEFAARPSVRKLPGILAAAFRA